MARPESRVSVGSVVNPLEGAGRIMTDYFDREVKKEQWQSENALRQEAAQQNRDEIARVSEQRDLLNTHTAGAVNSAKASVIADSGALGKANANVVNAYDSAKSRLLQNNTRFKDLDSRLTASRAAPKGSAENEASTALAEEHRQAVLDSLTPGSNGNNTVNVRDALLAPYESQQFAQEDISAKMRDYLVEKGVDYATAEATAQTSSANYKSKATWQEEANANREAVLEANKERTDREIKIAKEFFGGPGGSGRSKGSSTGDTDTVDILKLTPRMEEFVAAEVDEGGWSWAGTLDDREAASVMSSWVAKSAPKYGKNASLGAVTKALQNVNNKTKGVSGTSIDRAYLEANIEAEMNKLPGYSGTSGTRGSNPTAAKGEAMLNNALRAETGLPAVGSFADRNEARMSAPLDRLNAAYATPTKSKSLTSMASTAPSTKSTGGGTKKSTPQVEAKVDNGLSAVEFAKPDKEYTKDAVGRFDRSTGVEEIVAEVPANSSVVKELSGMDRGALVQEARKIGMPLSSDAMLNTPEDELRRSIAKKKYYELTDPMATLKLKGMLAANPKWAINLVSKAKEAFGFGPDTLEEAKALKVTNKNKADAAKQNEADIAEQRKAVHRQREELRKYFSRQ